jgi:hypothetical protein
MIQEASCPLMRGTRAIRDRATWDLLFLLNAPTPVFVEQYSSNFFSKVLCH